MRRTSAGPRPPITCATPLPPINPRRTAIETITKVEPAFKPFDAVLYDREESTGLYFLPGTLADKPKDNWAHLVVGHAVPRTLTEAELAAMHWHAHYSQMIGVGVHRDADGNMVDEAAVLEKFASLPAIR